VGSRVLEPPQFVSHCAVIEAFKKELKGFSTSKGTIQFPTDKPCRPHWFKKLVKARSRRTSARNNADRAAFENPPLPLLGVQRGALPLYWPIGRCREGHAAHLRLRNLIRLIQSGNTIVRRFCSFT